MNAYDVWGASSREESGVSCAMSLCEPLSIETVSTVIEMSVESEAPLYGVTRFSHLGARTSLSPSCEGCLFNCGPRV